MWQLLDYIMSTITINEMANQKKALDKYIEIGQD